MDTLASRGTNIIYQPTPLNTLPDTNVYTGAGTQSALSKSAIPAAIVLLGVLLILGFLR